MHCQSSNRKLMEDGLNMFFNIGVSRETEKNHFPWDSVSSYLKNHKEAVLTLDNAKLFCDFFIKVLENHACEETAIFNRIIDVMTVLLLEREVIYDRERRKLTDRYEELFRNKRKYHLELSICYLSEKMEVSVFSDKECIQVVNALKNKNYRLMQVLATYGCNVKFSNHSFYARKVASAMIRNFRSILDQVKFRDKREKISASTSLHSGFPEIVRIPHSSIENDTKLSNVQPNYYDLVCLSANPLWRPKSAPFKRLFLLILGIYALSLKLQNNPEFTNFVKCLEIVFKIISEPYIAVIEVRRLLTGYCQTRNKEYLLDEWCEVFKDTLPFCTRNYEPRSLYHLVRCQVRDNLCKSGGTLPTVLDQMKMPKKMKDFLLCKP